MCAITVFLLFVAPPIVVFYLAITVCFGIPWAYGYHQMNKRIASAKEDGTFERMMHEFGSAASILGDKIRYSEHYIFGKGSGRFLKYEDIYWVYRHIQRYLLIPISSTAEVGIRTGELFSFCRLRLGYKSGAGQNRELASVIYAKNPNVILWFDAKRKKEFKDRISQVFDLLVLAKRHSFVSCRLKIFRLRRFFKMIFALYPFCGSLSIDKVP